MTQQCSSQIALVMIMMLAGASATTNQLRPAQKHVQINMMQAQATTDSSVKVQKSVQSLQKALDQAIDGAESREASYIRLDDDKDDDKDKEVDAEEAKEDEAEEEELHAAQEARRQSKKNKVSLGEAKKMHKVAESDLKAFADEKKFDKKIAAEVKDITNETQSPALSSFLGEVRTEMREYAMPTYPNYLEDRVTAAEKKVAELEAELNGKTPAKTDKKEKDGKKKEGGEKKEEKEGGEKKEEKEGGDAKEAVEGPADDAEALEAAKQKAGETWAIGFFANVALLAVVFGMANAGDTAVKSYTWVLIDQVILIFLAVMYFQAFDSLLDFVDLGGHNHVLASVLHAVIMLAMVLLLAYILRNQEMGMAIVCGAGAHIVSFCSIHGASATQNGVFVSYDNTWIMMVAGLGVLGLGLFIIGYLVYTAKKRANVLGNDDFMDKTDDLENDFGSMAFSVVFTMFVRFLLTGHHPEDDETEMDHTQTQRHYMLAYACFALVVAGFATTYFSKKASEAAQENDYAKKRIWNFLTTVSAMNVAWAVLYWGEWEFFGALYPGEEIKGRVMFAIATTIAGGCGLIGLAKISDSTPKGDQTTRSAEKVAITAISLVVAWSWELCFDAAMDCMAEGAAHPVTMKVTAACTLFAIVIPVYALYIKPAIKANGGDA